MSDDLDTEEVLKGFDFLANSEDMEGPTEAPSAGDWGENHTEKQKRVCKFLLEALMFK